MKKAFFINGGAGRVLCAFPALEHYIKTVDPTAPIIAEGWPELYALSDTLRNNVYPVGHKGLMDVLKDRELVSPEPYRLNAYFNQKANLIQAFDMLINYATPPEVVPASKPFSLSSSKAEMQHAKTLIDSIKKETGKKKVVVFQPLGSTARIEGNASIDESGRSIEYADMVYLAKQLSKTHAVILMTNLEIPAPEPLQVAILNNINMMQWAGIISQADYFLGCDSAGQHYANALGVPATVVIGSTFPENISYPLNKDFEIVDLGKDRRIYSPIRITSDMMIERSNERLMEMSEKQLNQIISNINRKLGNK
jgi:ADP-heptose:LPS heptosyltransferase